MVTLSLIIVIAFAVGVIATLRLEIRLITNHADDMRTQNYQYGAQISGLKAEVKGLREENGLLSEQLDFAIKDVIGLLKED